MFSTRRRFQELWAPRSTKASAARRRRTNRANFSTFGGAEQLEQRALLAGVTAAYVDDYIQTSHTGGAYTYANTEKGALVLTIDANAVNQNGDDIFLRVVNNQYIFATDVSFSNPIFSIGSNYTHNYNLITKDPTAGPPPTPSVFTGYTSAFDTIVIKTNGLTDGVESPTFTLIGSSQNVTKSLIVDLTDNAGNPLSNSSITIGAPIVVSAASAGGAIGNQFTSPENLGGAIYLASESIALNAAVTSQNDLTLNSAVGADNQGLGVVPAGIQINQAVNVPGNASVTVSGTAFNVNAGGSIKNGGGAAGSFTLNLQDADARIVGTVNATDQSYFLQPTAGSPTNATSHTITTRSASTGVQAGTISGNQLLIYLANDAATGSDGSVDLQSGVANLRITSSATTLASTLDYGIKITNNKALLVDSVAASKGDISLATTAGTITLQAAIDTLGSFGLSSGADLTVDSAIMSGKNISLTSTAGSVATNAAIKTSEAATTDGQITIVAQNDVTINSLVQAEYDGVIITATTGQIQSGANLASDPSSRITGTSATLKAAAGIALGTSVGNLLATVSGKGDLVIDDNGSAGQFTVTSATSTDGSVAIRAARSVDVASLTAGGSGDVTIISTGGDIDLGRVVADGNAVTLGAVGYDTDGITVLHAGTVTGDAPTASEIAWTAGTAPAADLYRNIPTISANLLNAGDITFTSDNAVTLKSITTSDGSVNVTAADGSITATSVTAASVNNTADITITAKGGDVVVGSVATATGQVTILAAQAISAAPTTSATAVPTNDKRPNSFMLMSHQAGSTTVIDNLKVTDLDTNSVVYTNDFSTPTDATRNLRLFYWAQGGHSTTDYVTSGPMTTVSNGQLRLETTGFNQNGAGGYHSHSEAEFTGTMPTNFLVEFDAKRLQWAGRFLFYLWHRDATDPAGPYLQGGAFTPTRNSGKPNEVFTMQGEGSWFSSTGILDNFRGPYTNGENWGNWVGKIANPSGDMLNSQRHLGFELKNDTVTWYLDGTSVGSVSYSDWALDAAASAASSGTSSNIVSSTVTLLAAAGGAASDIGSSDNRIALASPVTGGTVNLTVERADSTGYPSAIDASNVYIASSDTVVVNAAAVDSIAIKSTGSTADIVAQSTTVSNADGTISLESARDLTATATTVGGGAYGSSSAVSLTAARTLSLDPSIDISVYSLSLTAGSFGTSLDLGGVDDVDRYSVEQTGSASLSVSFDKATDVRLQKVKASGNIVLQNVGAGSILIGSGGVTAGSGTDSSGVDITSQSQIGMFSDPVADTGSGGGGAFGGTAQPEAVAPAKGKVSQQQVTLSWQGKLVSAIKDSWVIQTSDAAVTASSLLTSFTSNAATKKWDARSLGNSYYSITAPGATQADVLGWAARASGVAKIQPDFVVTASAVPNDPQYGSQWGLNNIGQNGGTVGADIDAQQAWDTTTGSRSTVVAVIDTGVDYTHPDLAANMWRNPGEIAGDGIDNDGNGFVDDVYGWDFANNDANPMDDNRHGTHVAGTFAAVGNNGTGVTGVAWQTSIMALKFLGANGSGSTSNAIAAVNYATMMKQSYGVNVVATNNSWGGGGYDSLLYDAINAGGKAGILFVAAAGNAANNNDASASYPASYDSPYIISVAATDRNNNLASFSNYGATSVDIGAPGVEILSTLPNSSYGTLSGTSMATPHVSGLVALLASLRPTATTGQIRAAILNSAVPIPSLTGKVVTGGLLNAPGALASIESATAAAGGLVRLRAQTGISLAISAGQLSASSAAGDIVINQAGNVSIASAGIVAGAGATVTLDVTGAILAGSGAIQADVADVTTTDGMNLKTDVASLSAVSKSGGVTILESNGLTVGSGGISAAGGAVSLTLTQGTLSGGGRPIVGGSVDLTLLEAGKSLDVNTSASTLTASTASGGSITIRNDKSFAVGAKGIVAGSGSDDVSLTTASGYIQSTVQSGAIKADDLTLSATTGIIITATAGTLTATSSAGDIAIVQTGKALSLTSVVASAGSVAVSNDDDLTAMRVQAVGSGKNVSLTTSGSRKKISLSANSIFAEGDTVTLSATGGIDGTSNGSTADITAGTVVLASTGGDVTATVKSSTVTASGLGIDVDTGLPSDLDLRVIGTRSVFLGTPGGVNLAAAGDVTLRTGSNNIVVATTPTAGVGETIDLNTSGMVTFVVANTSASGAGSLAKAVQDGGSVTNTNPAGTVGVAFTTGVGSPIVLTSTIPVTSRLTLDGTQRINTSTGTLSTGRQVDIDGSRLVTGTSGFKFSGASDNSKVSGFAFYGFNKAGGAGVELSPAADNVTVSNNLFGISSTGRVSSNVNGVVVNSGVNAPVITGNTVVKSTDTGIKLSGVSNAVVTGNLVGTNTTRTNLGNATGIQVNGTGSGNAISSNVVAFNSVAGIHANGADASGGTATVVRGNEVLLNAAGILVNGATKNAIVAGNVVTRNTANGIAVNGSSQDVTIGGATAADRNYVGTNAANSLGLGNARNGILITSGGSGLGVLNNIVLGNGTANVTDDNAGVKLIGTEAIATVTDNTINSNRGSGVLAAGSWGIGVLIRNTISGNARSGVEIRIGRMFVGGIVNDVTTHQGNTITSNRRYGIELANGTDGIFFGNSMTGNALGGIYNPSGSPNAPTIVEAKLLTRTYLRLGITGTSPGDMIDVYVGGPQGRTYLGSAEHSPAYIGACYVFLTVSPNQVFPGAQIVVTRSTTHPGNPAYRSATSAFSAVKPVRW